MTSFRNPGIWQPDLPDRYHPDTAVTKTNREINRILQKEELTNRDMVKAWKADGKGIRKIPGATAPQKALK